MKTFILGLGAQKSGTTWLFRQLNKSSSFVPGLCKEYHLFDYTHLGMDGVRASAGKRIKNLKNGDPNFSYEEKLQLIDGFYDDPNRYYDYLTNLLIDDSKFTTDITPAYAQLESDVLAAIKSEMERRDVKVKVVYLMREPVARMESEIRMNVRRNKKFGQVDVKTMIKRFDHRLAGTDLKKSNYSFTVNQIDRAFPASDVFYCFYEELFNPENIKRLAEFAEIPVSLFDPSSKVNVTKKPYKYPQKDLERWMGYFADEYEFAQNRFGFDVEIWRSSLLEKLGRRRYWFWQ